MEIAEIPKESTGTTSTTFLNISLHFISGMGFAYFAYKAGDSYFGGVMAVLSLVILWDMAACIKARLF